MSHWKWYMPNAHPSDEGTIMAAAYEDAFDCNWPAIDLTQQELIVELRRIKWFVSPKRWAEEGGRVCRDTLKTIQFKVQRWGEYREIEILAVGERIIISGEEGLIMLIPF